jgi:hypothetical protein
MQFIDKAKQAAKNAVARGAAVATAAALPVLAHAQSSGSTTPTGPDFTQLTSGISFSTVVTAVMAVALALVGVYVAVKGAKIVLQMVRGS